MNTTAVPRSILQFTTGNWKGLLAQVVAVEGDKLKCLCRGLTEAASFFEVPIGDSYSVVGQAILGPKPKTEPPKPSLPPPLNAQELLEPLPADVKAVPMSEADIPPAVPLPPEARKTRSVQKRRVQPIFVDEQPKPPKPPPVKTEPYTALVKNALGDECTVTIGVPENRKPIQCNGWAVIRAGKIIPNVKPFTVSDWTKVYKPNESLGESGHREGNADAGAAQEQVAPTSQTAE